jgi:hypothetical protein
MNQKGMSLKHFSQAPGLLDNPIRLACKSHSRSSYDSILIMFQFNCTLLFTSCFTTYLHGEPNNLLFLYQHIVDANQYWWYFFVSILI